MEELMEGAINSFAKWDILVFLYRHPEALQSVEEISECVGREHEEVQEALRDLEAAGIAARKAESGNVLYFFHPAEKWKKGIEGFMEYLSDRKKRFLILAYIFEMKRRQG